MVINHSTYMGLGISLSIYNKMKEFHLNFAEKRVIFALNLISFSRITLSYHSISKLLQVWNCCFLYPTKLRLLECSDTFSNDFVVLPLNLLQPSRWMNFLSGIRLRTSANNSEKLTFQYLFKKTNMLISKTIQDSVYPRSCTFLNLIYDPKDIQDWCNSTVTL